MKEREFMKKSIAILIMLFAAAAVFADAVLSPEVLDKVMSSVFEVLVEKAPEANLEYERELPLSRIPFSIRSDEYSPIGTAFLMEDGCFYSAAHVFNLSDDSFYRKHYIRDRNGTVYPVQNITMYASDRDYISFTAEGFTAPEGAGLQQAEEQLNIPVFSVGNALGDGIVIRNGLLTSKTKEDRAGAWDWFRFSAAASPGNSGGPLITPEGKVLGIICMKSENENLNYALPFDEVLLAPKNSGFFMTEFSYSVPVIQKESFYHRYEKEFPLPQSLEAIQDMLITDFTNYCATVGKDLKTTFEPGGSRGFDQLPCLADIAVDTANHSFPLLLFSNEKDNWVLGAPTNISTKKLADEGYIKNGQMMGLNFAMLEKPETQSLRDLLSSHKDMMDTLLTAISFTRTVETDSIRITSFGEPVKSETYVDYFGRTWLVDEYDISFADKKIISFILPSPSGLFCFMGLYPSANVGRGAMEDLKLVADLFVVHCVASFDEWEEYLALADEGIIGRPGSLSGFSVSHDEESWTIENDEYRLCVPSSVQTAKDTVNIIMYPRFCVNEDGMIVTKARRIEILPSTRESDYSYIQLHLYPAPLDGASKSTQQSWTRIADEVAPYDGVPYNHDNYTYMDRVLRIDGCDDLVAIMGYELLGQNRNEEIQVFAEAVEQGLILKSNK